MMMECYLGPRSPSYSYSVAVESAGHALSGLAVSSFFPLSLMIIVLLSVLDITTTTDNMIWGIDEKGYTPCLETQKMIKWAFRAGLRCCICRL